MVDDTKPLEKTCSRCNKTKATELFILRRNICRECNNKRRKELYDSVEIGEAETRTCNSCNQTKASMSFIKNRQTCCDCNNERRRNRYKTDETYRLNHIAACSEYKHNRTLARQKKKLEENGENNKKCSKCNIIKNEKCFRYNRLKCRVCERDDPLDKFKRCIRSRIYLALNRNKNMHTIEYLGTNSSEYLKWIMNYNDQYTIENRGTYWHIDHVIPLSHFNLDDKDEQLIAFNWRNTMPFSASENLKKNCKIIPSQLEQHFEKLKEYHEKNNIELPETFIDLFAKHLDAGNTLKQSLPLSPGNLEEDLG